MNIETLRTLYLRYEGELPPLLRPESEADPALVYDLLLNAVQRHTDALRLKDDRQQTKDDRTPIAVGALPATPKNTRIAKNGRGVPRPYKPHSVMRFAQTSDLELGTSYLTDSRIKINDPRLNNAPQNVLSARAEIKRLMPLISHLHLQLVEASKKTATPQRNTMCKNIRQRLEEMITRRTEYWQIIDTYAETLR